MMTVSQSKEEFTELLMACQRRVVACIYAMVHNMADTQEIYQQACLTMWEKFDTFTPGTDFAKWASGIAYLKVLQSLQMRSRDRICFGDRFLENFAAWEAGRREEPEDRRAVALRKCVERLTECDRRLVQLRYGGTRRAGEIARELGRSPQSVSRSLGRIRLRLFECVRRTLSIEGS